MRGGFSGVEVGGGRTGRGGEFVIFRKFAKELDREGVCRVCLFSGALVVGTRW